MIVFVLGKGEVLSSILSGSTSFPKYLAAILFPDCDVSEREQTVIRAAET